MMATLMFVAAVGHVSGPRGIDPVAVFLEGLFLAVLALGAYGIATGVAAWRTRNSKPEATEIET